MKRNLKNKSNDLWVKIEIDAGLIASSLELAKRDIKTSKEIFAVGDYDWTFSIAYNAMLQAARALMFAKGFRSKGEQKHLSVVEFVKTFFTKDFSEKQIFMFNKMRKKRHLVIYEQSRIITEDEAKRALKVARSFLNVVSSLI
jgi:uncharacterized protein (UPF0332 family)